MNKVIIFAENFEGVFKKATFEAVSYGSRIVEQMGGGEVIAISLGEVADEELKSLGAYGATRVISLHNEAFNSLDAKIYAKTIADNVKKENAGLIIFTDSNASKAVAPRVAVRLHAGMVFGAYGLPSNLSPFTIPKKVFYGKAFTEVVIQSEVKVISLSQNSFGVDEETEQILQILHSNRIRDRIIEEFGLEQHYGINPESKYRLSKLHRQYENNISFRRTEFMAIRISVLDTDPNYAADIANRISDLLDSTKSQIQHERAKKAFEIVKSQYFKLADEMQQMEDSLTELRKHGVQDYESQAEMLNMQLAKEMAANNTVGVQRLQEKLDILAQYGGAYVNIRDRLEYEREKLSLLKAKYEEAKTDAEEVLPTKFVVNSAFPAERKSYPIRWLIISVTTISAFFFALIIILILENVKQNFPFIASKAKTKRQQGLNTKDENREINDQFDKQGKPLAFTSKNGTEVKNANKISEEDLSVISGSIIEQIKK